MPILILLTSVGFLNKIMIDQERIDGVGGGLDDAVESEHGR